MTDQPLPDTLLDLEVLAEEIESVRAAAFAAVSKGDFAREAELRARQSELENQYRDMLNDPTVPTAMTAREIVAEQVEAVPEPHPDTFNPVIPTLHGTIPG